VRFTELSAEATDHIGHQIEALLDAFSNRGRLGKTKLPRGLSIFESCRENILDLPEQWAEILRSQESDHIEQWRRPDATWYHQLRTNSKVFGFARSIVDDKLERGGHRVIEVVPSTVAKEFQKAIDIIDADPSENELTKRESTAVFLHVPRYALYGLATPAEGAISLVYPFFRERLDVSEQKLGRGSFLTLLEHLPSAFGAINLEPLSYPR
jgi:hypothetical protein